MDIDLPREPTAPGLARQLLHAKFVTELHQTELDTAKLLVSELVTNAVLHGRGMITLRADLDRNRLRVDVIDEGTGFDRAVRKRDFDSLGGRGLHIVDIESSRWGVHGGTTHVWFELERSGPRLDPD